MLHLKKTLTCATVAFLFLAVSLLPVASVYAASKDAVKKEMTKEEMISRIRKNISRIEDIVNFVPGMQKTTDQNGKTDYLYNGKKLEDYDKKVIEKIYVRTSAEFVRIRTDRLNKQLETIRRAEQLANRHVQSAPVPAPPPTPPSVPNTYTPREAPRTPYLPAQNISTPPAVPAQVPSRRD